MPTGDSTDTRARLLRAGLVELSTHGLAGARVDRVAAAAGLSKQGIYNYFGGKDGLFLAVLEKFVTEPLDTLAFDPLDLPDYAGRLFDLLEKQPDIARLITWHGIASSPEPATLPPAMARRVELIRDAQEHGYLRSELNALETLLAVHALPLAWHAHPGLNPPDSAATRLRRREASRDAARNFAHDVSAAQRKGTTQHD
ncbi:TetR family transcriptional regulator [Conyzicola sp.]|uniref:TetR family transcriptional regulator n=1 Tax=Conyzicola sp. TaxID=1969404 RepID=UPI00398A2192